MKLRNTLAAAASLATALAWTAPAQAHCDTVLSAARIRSAFDKVRNVRKAGALRR